MRKQITIIETEWERRKARKERTSEKAAARARKAAKAKRRGKERFINATAQKLRNSPPKSEQWFLAIMQAQGIDSHFLNNIRLNDMIPDYISVEHRIVIEVDGSIHWDNQAQLAKDAKKDAAYKALGYQVYRVNHKDEARALEIVTELKNKVTPISREMRGDNGPSTI